MDGKAKMGQKRPPKPTEGELEILKVLWEHEGATVREVFESLNQQRPTGYTTVLKILQIMTEKGLVVRDEEQRAHVYRARLRQDQTQRQVLGDILDRLFNGSQSQLVMQALSSKRTPPTELARIRRMLDQLEKGDDSDA